MNKYFDNFRFYKTKEGDIRTTKLIYKSANKTWVNYYPLPIEGYLKYLKKFNENK
jgi:hypothetical protein